MKHKFEELHQSWSKRRPMKESEKNAPRMIDIQVDDFAYTEGLECEVIAGLDNDQTVTFTARVHANWTYELGKDKDDPSQITSWGLQGLGDFDHIGIKVMPD